MDDCKKDINRLGEKVNRIENEQGRHDVRIKDNKETILELRSNAKEFGKQIEKLTQTINDNNLKITQSINRGIRWAVGAIFVPLILFFIILYINKQLTIEVKNGKSNISTNSHEWNRGYNKIEQGVRTSRGTK